MIRAVVFALSLAVIGGCHGRPITIPSPEDDPRWIAASPAESLARARTRPARRPGDLVWYRMDQCRLWAWAPAGAVAYADGGLVRNVYRSGNPAAWVDKLRVERCCGWPPKPIEITYADGRVESVMVEAPPCGGY